MSPIYEFSCGYCGRVQELRFKNIEDADKSECSCPYCGKKKMKRIMSLSSFQLKGGGWARDGYAKKGGKR